MKDLYQNKYRIATTRASWWDYGWNATYFVTICTQDRICYFGNIKKGEMRLSEIGVIANTCWLEIPKHFPFVKLGNHIIMPNHVHGIIIIDKPGDGRLDDDQETQNFVSLPPQSHNDHTKPKNKFGPQSKNLASIIRGFKIGVTKNARHIHADFAWQPRYHDHIIRNYPSFQNISNYIKNNPSKWSEDRFHRS
ncbi:transposase [Fulvivirgaceae bacterium BMA10]|uniref:Transposase n=1 Tax=Splendidivirga corallicola TaxID=3051826 RepID=A0ABT8KTU0_9BACT|nr:transposase [Fulvivirgaceae bacterium BMA10]